jgi:serine/threonine protein kinase
MAQGEEQVGKLAVERGWMTVQQLGEALAKQVIEARPLSQILVDSGFLTADQVKQLSMETMAPVVKLPGPLSKDLPIEVQQAAEKPENNVADMVLVKLLGVGGMGKVYLAWEKPLKRYVAVKFVTADANILREAQASAKLEHEAIIPVYKVEHKEPAYIVMKYVEGDTLNKTYLSMREKVKAIRDATLALAHAHAQGIIHRDIKPQNIMIERASANSKMKTRRFDPEARKIYVMDFGLARLQNVETSLSASGAVLGTPQYMPPEQAMGKPRDTDERSDIYSLGATLYHLLTGVPPFAGEGAMMVLYKVIQEKPKSIREYDPNVPVELEQIVMKCLEKKKERRYQKAEELADDLDKFLLGKPVEVEIIRPSFGEWVGENLRTLGIVGILVASILASLFILTMNQGGIPAHAVSSLVFTPDGKHLAAGSREKSIVIWNAENARPRGHWIGSIPINSVAFSPDSKLLVGGTESGTILLWSWETEKEPRSVKGPSTPITWVTFMPDGQQFITAGADGTVKRYESKAGIEVGTLCKADKKILQLAVHPSGQKVAAVSSDGFMMIVDVAQREIVKTLPGPFTSVGYNVEGDLIVAGMSDGRIQLMLEKDGSKYRELSGHSSDVRTVRFSSDGITLLSGSADRTIRAWDYRNGHCLMTQNVKTSGEPCMAMSRDGLTIASGGNDGQVNMLTITYR